MPVTPLTEPDNQRDRNKRNRHKPILSSVKTFARQYVCCFVIGLAFSFAAQGEPLKVLYSERPPYLITESNGHVRGLTGTPAWNAFQSLNQAISWEQVPSKRQMVQLKSNKNKVCSVGWFKNEERLSYVKYTNSIYHDRPLTLVIRASDKSIYEGITLQQVLGHRDLTLIVKSGYSYGPYIDRLLNELKPSIFETTLENRDMLEMIIHQRADYFFAAQEEATTLISEASSPEFFSQHHFTDKISGEKRYIICSKLVSNSTIEQLNRWITNNIVTEE